MEDPHSEAEELISDLEALGTTEGEGHIGALGSLAGQEMEEAGRGKAEHPWRRLCRLQRQVSKVQHSRSSRGHRKRGDGGEDE